MFVISEGCQRMNVVTQVNYPIIFHHKEISFICTIILADMLQVIKPTSFITDSFQTWCWQYVSSDTGVFDITVVRHAINVIISRA